jgi:hypothetical protein
VRCKECGGSALCEHDKQKIRCKECGGSGICEHGKVKYSCKDCGGSTYCKHGIQKVRCKECGGSALCKHYRQKHKCKECGGSGICEHGKVKYRCRTCGVLLQCPSEHCDYTTADKTSMKMHAKTCKNGRVGSSGEVYIKNTLDAMEIKYDYDQPYEVSNINMLRWDFKIVHENKPYFIEYNGRQHYEPIQFGGISWEKAEENFKKQQCHDKMKADYCKANGYVLLVIHCNHYGNIPAILSDFAYTHLGWGVGE